ncbi:class I SAM-dependent methyltransferase [Chitinophaga sp.]|uniref:class I SAM-dependent methyltransferase n=1 Tax=Chitinophaga sp. TaxID=1869181 RepID=UPI0031E29DDF
MEKTLLKRGYFANDAAFDWLYPQKVRELSKRHWTPLAIAEQAAAFLADGPGKKILDVGSGVGKFCLAAAHFQPQATFYGVEQRYGLHQYALAAKDVAQVNNVEFIHDNFTRIDLSSYDNFYFYNSFFENLDDNDRIDEEVAYSTNFYIQYCRYLYRALERKPAGTRLVTFHSLQDEVPPAFQVVYVSDDLQLKMWIKR